MHTNLFAVDGNKDIDNPAQNHQNEAEEYIELQEEVVARPHVGQHGPCLGEEVPEGGARGGGHKSAILRSKKSAHW